MNKYYLNAYKKPFILKDGTKVYQKIDTFDEIKGTIALLLTIISVIFILIKVLL